MTHNGNIGMIKIPGKKNGTFAYLYNGYRYAQDNRGERNRYRCTTRNTTGCKGIAIVVAGSVTETAHNHQPEVHQVEKHAMIQQMIEMAQVTSLEAHEIFKQVCAENESVGQHLSFKNIGQRIDKVRAQLRPELPTSLEAVHVVLKNYAPLKDVYQGIIKTADTCGLLFSTQKLMSTLRNKDRLFVDSTVTLRVSEEFDLKLYAVHSRVVNVNVAGAFVLSETDALELYEAIWTKICQEVTTVRNTVKSVICDYGTAAMGAIRSRLPKARCHGSWIFYRQELLRQWINFGLTEADKELLWMAMSLPLAPANKFDEGLLLMQSKCNDVAEEFSAKAFRFLSYLRKTWGPNATKINVHDGIIRTNNAAEYFHQSIKNSFDGVHRDLWKVFHILKKLVLRHEKDLQDMKKKKKVKRPTPLIIKNRDRRMTEMQHGLASGRVSLDEFLRAFSKFYENDTYGDLYNNECLQSAPAVNVAIDGSLFEAIPDEDDDDHRDKSDSSESDDFANNSDRDQSDECTVEDARDDCQQSDGVADANIEKDQNDGEQSSDSDVLPKNSDSDSDFDNTIPTKQARSKKPLTRRIRKVIASSSSEEEYFDDKQLGKNTPRMKNGRSLLADEIASEAVDGASQRSTRQRTVNTRMSKRERRKPARYRSTPRKPHAPDVSTFSSTSNRSSRRGRPVGTRGCKIRLSQASHSDAKAPKPIRELPIRGKTCARVLSRPHRGSGCPRGKKSRGKTLASRNSRDSNDTEESVATITSGSELDNDSGQLATAIGNVSLGNSSNVSFHEDSESES